MFANREKFQTRLSVIILCLAAWGCAEVGLNRFKHRFDSMIGQHKDSLVRDMGVPHECIPLRSGEACQWIQRGGTDTGPISGAEGIGMIKNDEALNLYFDKKQVACEWRYDGFYGVQRSRDKCTSISSQ